MTGFFFTLFFAGLVVSYAVIKRRREDAARDAAFRAVMLGLEEKAKREGTYVVSYFASENAKNS